MHIKNKKVCYSSVKEKEEESDGKITVGTLNGPKRTTLVPYSNMDSSDSEDENDMIADEPKSQGQSRESHSPRKKSQTPSPKRNAHQREASVGGRVNGDGRKGPSSPTSVRLTHASNPFTMDHSTSTTDLSSDKYGPHVERPQTINRAVGVSESKLTIVTDSGAGVTPIKSTSANWQIQEQEALLSPSVASASSCSVSSSNSTTEWHICETDQLTLPDAQHVGWTVTPTLGESKKASSDSETIPLKKRSDLTVKLKKRPASDNEDLSALGDHINFDLFSKTATAKQHDSDSASAGKQSGNGPQYSERVQSDKGKSRASGLKKLPCLGSKTDSPQHVPSPQDISIYDFNSDEDMRRHRIPASKHTVQDATQDVHKPTAVLDDNDCADDVVNNPQESYHSRDDYGYDAHKRHKKSKKHKRKYEEMDSETTLVAADSSMDVSSAGSKHKKKKKKHKKHKKHRHGEKEPLLNDSMESPKKKLRPEGDSNGE